MVPCEQWDTMATMVNNRQQYIVQNMSHRYCLKALNFIALASVVQEEWRKARLGWGDLPGLIGLKFHQTPYSLEAVLYRSFRFDFCGTVFFRKVYLFSRTSLICPEPE